MQGRKADELLLETMPCVIRAVRVGSDLCGVARSTRCFVEARISVAGDESPGTFSVVLRNIDQKGSHG